VLDIQLGRGDLAGAKESLALAVKIAPQAGLTALLDARLRLADGDIASGEPLIAALVGRAPDFEAARIVWASALLAVGKREQALSEATQLARRRQEVANLAAATEVMRAGVALPAGTEEFWLNNARAQMLLGQPALARQALDNAEVIAPESTRVAIERIRLEINGGNAAGALRRAQALVARQPDEHVAMLLLAQAQRYSGDLNASLETLRRVHAHQPSAGTAALIFTASRELGTEDGFTVLKAWTDSHPEERALRLMLAEGLLSAGRNREAITEFEKMLAVNPNVVFALNNLAWLYHLEKDARALETARKAFKLAPKSPQIADTYGWLLLEQGAQAESLQVFLDAEAASPLLDPECRYHFAVALARNGKNEAAAHQLSLLLLETGDFQSRPAAEALAVRLN
jgi:Tfp pilus assembly protein PilF